MSLLRLKTDIIDILKLESQKGVKAPVSEVELKNGSNSKTKLYIITLNQKEKLLVIESTRNIYLYARCPL